MTATTPPTRRQVTRHRVRNELQRMILSGERPPGTKLVQQHLAGLLGVAQGVVREALLELQACGLVETIDNRGVYVSRLNRQKMIESYQIREVHEGLAARLCSGLLSPQQLGELRDLADRSAAMAQKQQFTESGVLDREFHHRLLEFCGNGTLLRLADNYQLVILMLRASPRRAPHCSHREHRAIVDAIEKGEGDIAERLARAHIRVSLQVVCDGIGKENALPYWLQ